ncbi:hypothetical protein LCGC14_2517030 [marine sediment metagenome]|uniref:Uncharacterized protein n=1 Tax=marine sediment metagenome TaxID=412755 RepID=A0A0F9BKH4_9ZZZZ|nr:hypothetical protein [bacterium]
MDKQRDIWREGIKSIMSYVKRSLLDYVDACDKQMKDQKVGEMLGKIKGRIHNDVSQGELMIGILFTTKDAGGDISDFQTDLRTPSRRERAERHFNNNKNSMGNTVIKPGDNING